MTAETMNAVRQCVVGHRAKDAFHRVLKECGLHESEFDDKAKMLAHLMYVEGRADQLSDVSDETAKILEGR